MSEEEEKAIAQHVIGSAALSKAFNLMQGGTYTGDYSEITFYPKLSRKMRRTLLEIGERQRKGEQCAGNGMSKETEKAETINLTERRAEFVYASAALAAKAKMLPRIRSPWKSAGESFKAHFSAMVERQCSDQRLLSQEELHDAWMQGIHSMGWGYGTEYSREDKTHPSYAPHSDLCQMDRDMYDVFIALCEIARQSIK